MDTNPAPIALTALNDSQLETVEAQKDLNVPATWFIGTPDETGQVEVIAVGFDFLWSFLIAADGSYASSEAALGQFSTGIEV